MQHGSNDLCQYLIRDHDIFHGVMLIRSIGSIVGSVRIVPMTTFRALMVWMIVCRMTDKGAAMQMTIGTMFNGHDDIKIIGKQMI